MGKSVKKKYNECTFDTVVKWLNAQRSATLLNVCLILCRSSSCRQNSSDPAGHRHGTSAGVSKNIYVGGVCHLNDGTKGFTANVAL